MSDFLLEIRSEEIPARMQSGARKELEKLFRREMEEAGVELGDVTIWSTPRRLALIARGLPEATEAVRDRADTLITLMMCLHVSSGLECQVGG